MHRGAGWARERFEAARVARLATVGLDGSPHLVPVVFALVGDLIVTAVDHKPKSTTRLRRLANIAAHPGVTLLVDEYDEDWGRLWWARADGRAAVHASWDLAPLVAKYDQYADRTPTGPVIVVEVSAPSGPGMP